MGKPRNCNCCDFNLPSGFVCIYCDDSGDSVCTESLTSVQCSGVSGIHMPGSCSDFPGGFCGKCDDDFESSSCESFFLSKSGPVKGDSNVFASGSYSPEKPLHLESRTQFPSHFKRGHEPRIYKGTGTYGWLSGIVTTGGARLEFVNNQFPYIEGSHSADIEYIGLCDKRKKAKYGCATIKFKNTLVGSTTTKLDKFHLKIGTFQRYGDTAYLASVLVGNNQMVPAKYVGPFTSVSEHNSKFASVCKDPADSTARGGNGTVIENIAHLMSYFVDGSAHCYGGLQMACCSKLTKSMSAEYEFDVSSFPMDTCFSLHNFATVGTSSSSYGYFELTGESRLFFEASIPTFDQNFPECTQGFFSDNFAGCRSPLPRFDCDPPPPPPPPVTTTTTQDPCPPDSPSVIHCRYDYIESNSADEPPGYKKWRRKGFPSDSNCECDCPSTAQISNEWNSANGGEPQIGQCADAYVPCCKPNPPSSCFDYTVTFNPECGTTTTTTEGPTTTTSTTDPPEQPFFVTVCLSPLPCPDCPEKIQQTKRCVNFPNKAQADAHATDLQNMGLIPFKGPGTCDDATGFTCKSCDDPGPCNTTTTTANPCSCEDVGKENTQGGLSGANCQWRYDGNSWALIYQDPVCSSCDDINPECFTGPNPPIGTNVSTACCSDPTTTTTGPPTTTTTQGPTTTTTQGPTTTTTQGPTTTTTEGPTTTTTTPVPLGCCRDCGSDCCGYGIFYNGVTEEFCDGIGGTFDEGCFTDALLARCCVSQLPGQPCEGTPCSSCDDDDDPDNPDVPDDDPTGGGGPDTPTPA